MTLPVATAKTRKLWNTLIGALWLSLPVIGFRYWTVWEQLPVRVASHFDATGRANGWMPRETSLAFALGFLTLLCGVFTVVLYIMHRKYSIGTLSWALLAFFHMELWTIVFMLNSTVDYNLYGTPIVTAPIMWITPLGVLGVVAVGLTEKCGTALPPGELVAEEVHSGKAWSPFFAVPAVAALAIFFALPNFNVRFGAGLLCLLFIAIFGMAWDGFHYYFTRHGVEIRSLGLRLKSIPLGQIRQYSVGDWSVAGGYGIRGMGNHKAYVWGNHGVRIEMWDGEVFLGHSDPQRIVHDLDLIKQSAH